jgi:hypothetical protein
MLGFQEGKQQQTSQSQSTSSGFNTSSSFGLTGSDSTSTSAGQSASQQNVFLADLLKQVYGGAAGAAAGVDTGGIASASSQLFSGGLNFLDRLSSNPGADALAARATGGPSDAANAQLDTLKTQLGDFFSTNLAPAITSRGVATGTLGGSRDAVELGQAAKSVASQFSTGASSILASDQAARDAAAGKLADVNNTAAGTGLNALQSLFGLQQAGATAGLQPYQILSSIIGGPTVLGSSESSQLASALSSSFGEQGSTAYGYDQSQSTSSSQGTEKHIGLQFGTGLPGSPV